MKVLILTPEFNRIGGVANHFKGLANKFSVDIDFFFVGNHRNNNYFSMIFHVIKNYYEFIKKISTNNYNVIHLNPSLDTFAVIRDSIFLIICKYFKCKTVFFIHGWDVKFQTKIDKRYVFLIKKIFNLADIICVLSSEFKTKLESWGIKSTIELSTTKVDDDLVKSFSISLKKYNQNILVLSRIEKAKGIEISINTFELIIKKFPHAHLFIVGTGSYKDEAMQLVKDREITNVHFTGQLNGQDLINVFNNCSIYLFPTFHGEGMPTSVLEAMAFGLPVITRAVGGVIDFFENGKMGYLVQSKDAAEYAKIIQDLFNNESKIKMMSELNNVYATEHFLASKVAKKLENLYFILNKKRI